MVPLRDDNPVQITPYVTYGLIVVNVLVFLYEIMLTQADPNQHALNAFLNTWSVVPAELTASFSGAPGAPREWLTLLTSQFLHAGFFHVGGNMLYLWIFGNNIEEKLGRIKFLVFYLGCGVFAALAQWFFSMNSEIPSLGASGAIAGVMGAYVIRFPQAKILTLVPLGILLAPIRIPAVYFLGFWFFQQALYGLAGLGVSTNIGMENGGVAYWAHAGGFVIGVVLGPLLGLFSDRSLPLPGRRF
ncbi:MAG TPA: rhomboid family intramembrane serine protease [Chroococcidiopsis sp.]